MTNTEFSNEFDIQYNNIMSNAAPGLDEYEKSVFLTKAQEQIVIELYNGKSGLPFEKNEEVRRYLSNLSDTIVLKDKLVDKLGLTKTSMFFQIPDKVWFITYESAILDDERLGCLNGTEAVVVPASQDYFFKTQKNPFRGPSETRVLRLDMADNVIEIVSDYNIREYLIRFLKRPSPIVLADLSTIGQGLSIDGVSAPTECELNPVTHRSILDRAVLLAKAAWSSGTGGN